MARYSANPSDFNAPLNPGVSINIIRRRKGPIPYVASGVRSYIALFGLLGVQYPHATGDNVKKRGSLFNPRNTFDLYDIHLSKASVTTILYIESIRSRKYQ